MTSIILTKNKKTIIDSKDFKWLNRWKWYYRPNGYAVREIINKNGKKQLIYMHRTILDVPIKKLTDHINGNRLDNRRKNLRIVNRMQNAQNACKRKDNTSGYKGVSFNKNAKKWNVKISFNKKRFSLGYFNTPELAAKQYNWYAKIFHGEYAKLNSV